MEETGFTKVCRGRSVSSSRRYAFVNILFIFVNILRSNAVFISVVYDDDCTDAFIALLRYDTEWALGIVSAHLYLITILVGKSFCPVDHRSVDSSSPSKNESTFHWNI